MLALPYIPAAHIPVGFTVLQAQAGGAVMESLMSYIDINWISENVWPAPQWSVYSKPMQTHGEVNSWASAKVQRQHRMHFYKLIKVSPRQNK